MLTFLTLKVLWRFLRFAYFKSTVPHYPTRHEPWTSDYLTVSSNPKVRSLWCAMHGKNWVLIRSTLATRPWPAIWVWEGAELLCVWGGVGMLKRKDNLKTLGCVCWVRVWGGVGMVCVCVCVFQHCCVRAGWMEEVLDGRNSLNWIRSYVGFQLIP